MGHSVSRAAQSLNRPATLASERGLIARFPRAASRGVLRTGRGLTHGRGVLKQSTIQRICSRSWSSRIRGLLAKPAPRHTASVYVEIRGPAQVPAAFLPLLLHTNEFSPESGTL